MILLEIKSVAIVGAGALGILMGDFCLRVLPPACVRFLADEARIARYEAEGLFLNGQRCNFHYGAAGASDLVIFAVKAPDLEAAIALAAPCVGENTILLSLLNGVTSEEAIGAALGREKVIHAVAQGMDATRVGNYLTCDMPGELRIGYPAGETDKQERLDALAAFLTRIGVKHTVEADIMHRLWGKLMLNVGVNQCCTAFACDYGGVQRPGRPRDTLFAAMEEVRTVARCAGVTLTREDLEGYVALMDTLTPVGLPSMRQDALAGRKTELALFAGTVLDYAARYGLDTPTNRWLYEEISRTEAAYPGAEGDRE